MSDDLYNIFNEKLQNIFNFYNPLFERSKTEYLGYIEFRSVSRSLLSELQTLISEQRHTKSLLIKVCDSLQLNELYKNKELWNWYKIYLRNSSSSYNDEKYKKFEEMNSLEENKYLRLQERLRIHQERKLKK